MPKSQAFVEGEEDKDDAGDYRLGFGRCGSSAIAPGALRAAHDAGIIVDVVVAVHVDGYAHVAPSGEVATPPQFILPRGGVYDAVRSPAHGRLTCTVGLGSASCPGK